MPVYENGYSMFNFFLPALALLVINTLFITAIW